MKYIFHIVLVLFSATVYASVSSKEKLKKIDPYIQSDPDSAIVLSKIFLNESLDNDDAFGIVKSNLYLGYLHEKKGDYGKAVIYYLEGIRQSDDLTYDNITSDRIWLRRNIANIFRSFQANGLATQYNLEGIEIAEQANITFQIIEINENQGLVYQDEKEYSKALQCFERVLDVSSDGHERNRMINLIGLIHLDQKKYEEATSYFSQLLNIQEEYKSFEGQALHNLGEIAYHQGNSGSAISYLKEAISTMEKVENIEKRKLFISYRTIGEYTLESGDLDQAEVFLQKAEALFDYAQNDLYRFKVFKHLASLYLQRDNNDQYNTYNELYFDKVQKYLDTQDEIQQQDKEYNFDLITKRYFDEVESQERIASIMQTSKISIGVLVALLLITIAYHWFDKVRIRRNIEKELTSLQIFD